MKYFVTGGFGFIGSVLVKKLLTNKNEVVVYDNLSSGRLDHLKNYKKNPKLKFLQGNILDKTKLSKSMKNCNFVYHLAANPDIRRGEKETRLDFKINTIGTLNILDSMLKNKIKKIVFTSSSTVFGIPTKVPTSEDYGPSLPISLYGASKLACEGFISAYANMFNFKAWIFRLANITGKPTTHGIIYDFVKKIRKNSSELEILGDGNQEKSYITNEMLVDAMQYIVNKTIKRKDFVFLYNIGNDDTIKVKSITKMFVKYNNLKTKLRYTGGKIGWKGDVSIMLLSNKRIKKLGWKPRKSSKQCIEEAISANKLG